MSPFWETSKPAISRNFYLRETPAKRAHGLASHVRTQVAALQY